MGSEPGNLQSRHPLRLLVAGVSWPPETFIRRLLEGLARAGVELTIAGSRRPNRAWLERFGVRFVRLPSGSRRNDLPVIARAIGGGPLRHRTHALSSLVGRSDTASLRGEVVERLLGSGTFDLAYVPWINNLTEHPEMLESDVPVVTSCRGSLITVSPWAPDADRYRYALRDVFGSVAAAHCVSCRMVEEASSLGLDRRKAEVITPAVDTDSFTPPTASRAGRSRLSVVAVGSLIWRKSYEHAIVAVADAISRGCDLEFTIVGDGSERQRCQFTAQDLRVAHRVTLVGAKAEGEVRQYLCEADVFLHSSCEEGISNAVLEAMACGLPVVTTDAGGIAEAVRDGVEGFVVGVRDTSRMADALVRLTEDEELRLAMGRAARERACLKFRIEDQVSRFVDLFSRVTGGGRG